VRPAALPARPETLSSGERPPRVLHIGNIGNNAYQNARILNSSGVSSDVLCYDYYHAMGCPEWEDGDIGELPTDFDEGYPCWSRLQVGGFVRPPWFVQGPAALAAWYLHARLDGAPSRQRRLWRVLEASRTALEPARTRTALQVAYRLANAAVQAPALLRPLNGPEQRHGDTGRTEGGLWKLRVLARFLAPLMARYDVVIGYATDAILPLLAGHSRYAAFEHGTLRSLPFENNERGRLTARAYREAACALVTNCDNIRAVERLALANALYVPHPMNDALLEAADGTAVRRRLEEERGADFVVFHPSRHHWEAQRHPSWEKGNDVLLEGFARLVKEVDARALLVTVRWGRTVRESEELLRQLGIAHRVLWVPPMPNRKLLEYIRAADVVADQFWLGTFGGITPKAMACGRPAMLHLDRAVHDWCFSEPPPVLQARSAAEAFEVLRRARLEPAYLEALGAQSRSWYRANHSESSIRKRLLDALGSVLESAAPGPVRSRSPQAAQRG